MFKNSKKINIQNENGENDYVILAIVLVITCIATFTFFYTCLRREENRVYNNYESARDFVNGNLSDTFSNLNGEGNSNLIDNIMGNNPQDLMDQYTDKINNATGANLTTGSNSTYDPSLDNN